MLGKLWSFEGRYRILHMTWIAFFLCFLVWFNFAPFTTTIQSQLHLTNEQIKTIGICNLALTIPARIVIGMILDRFGARITFSAILIYSAIPCIAFAMASDFNGLVISRLAMGIAGAGFVVGIRIVADWFPPKEIGSAQGIYGGWGNFGAAGAELLLPLAALATAFLSGGLSNWRLIIGLTGVISGAFGFLYFIVVRDTPPGTVYKKPQRSGALEVTSVNSFYALLISNLGLVAAIGLIAWNLAGPKVKFINQAQLHNVWIVLAIVCLVQTYFTWSVNKDILTGQKTYPSEERYLFRQVALLELSYAVSFGVEVATVTMLPAFLEKSFKLNAELASMIAAVYPMMNLVSRPGGGFISDLLGSRKWTLIAITGGTGISYLLLRGINGTWPLPLAIALIVICGFFAQAGCGATFGLASLVKKSITGQIAGYVGAYGNAGATMFLIVLTLTNPQGFFTAIGLSSVIAASLFIFCLKEPANSFAIAVEGVAVEAEQMAYH